MEGRPGPSSRHPALPSAQGAQPMASLCLVASDRPDTVFANAADGLYLRRMPVVRGTRSRGLPCSLPSRDRGPR